MEATYSEWIHQVFHRGRVRVSALQSHPRRRAETVLWHSSSALYSYSELKSVVNKYVEARQLTNPRDRSYVNVGTDEVLLSTVCAKGEAPESVEFLKREDIVRRLSEKMQNWYEVRAEGKDPVLKYVTLSTMCRGLMYGGLGQERTAETDLGRGQSSTGQKGEYIGDRIRVVFPRGRRDGR